MENAWLNKKQQQQKTGIGRGGKTEVKRCGGETYDWKSGGREPHTHRIRKISLKVTIPLSQWRSGDWKKDSSSHVLGNRLLFVLYVRNI